MLDPSLISYLNDPRFPLLMQKNNPGNVQSTDKPILGQINFRPTQKPTTCVFVKYHYGVGALLQTINYRYNDLGLITLAKMLNKWTDNEKTNKSLLGAVSKGMGVDPKEEIEWVYSNIHLLTQEICRYNIRQDPRINSELFGFLWLKI